MAAASAVVTVPLPRAMTTRTGVWFGSWNGVASRAADKLGLLAGSWSVLFSLMTLASDGRSKVASMVAATQAETMAQRNRTANRPVAAKNVCIMAKSPQCRHRSRAPGLAAGGAPGYWPSGDRAATKVDDPIDSGRLSGRVPCRL